MKPETGREPIDYVCIMPPTMTEKLAAAIAYLRSRNLYALDKGSRKPDWSWAGDDVKRGYPGDRA